MKGFLAERTERAERAEYGLLPPPFLERLVLFFLSFLERV
jgi:hypothetical protein